MTNRTVNGHPASARLSDYLDGTLEPDERRVMEAHLAACDSCSSTLEDLREVVDHAHGAGEGPLPPADLWLGIAPRLAPRSEVWWRRAIGPAGWRWLPQAAVLAAACVVGAVWVVQDRANEAIVMPADREYDDRVAGLLRVVRERLTHDPQVLAVLEQNLEALNVAIADYRDLLAAEPEDPRVKDRVAAVRERKLDLLERAAALAEVAN